MGLEVILKGLGRLQDFDTVIMIITCEGPTENLMWFLLLIIHCKTVTNDETPSSPPIVVLEYIFFVDNRERRRRTLIDASLPTEWFFPAKLTIHGGIKRNG
jgi:hypothetical protein